MDTFVLKREKTMIFTLVQEIFTLMNLGNLVTSSGEYVQGCITVQIFKITDIDTD